MSKKILFEKLNSIFRTIVFLINVGMGQVVTCVLYFVILYLNAVVHILQTKNIFYLFLFINCFVFHDYFITGGHA